MVTALSMSPSQERKRSVTSLRYATPRHALAPVRLIRSKHAIAPPAAFFSSSRFFSAVPKRQALIRSSDVDSIIFCAFSA